VTAFLVILLSALGALHAAWGAGSCWPARSEADLVARVIGRTRNGKMPSPLACFAVAGCLWAAAWLAASASSQSSAWVIAGYYGAAGVFLLRGLAGFVGPLWRYAEGTPFHRFNRRYCAPLCLLIAGLFIAQGVLANVR
jgi:hypothetical protein